MTRETINYARLGTTTVKVPEPVKSFAPLFETKH
jgi:hypothetical protein